MATEQQSLDSIIMPHLRLELTNEEKQRYRTTRLKDSNASLTVGQENTSFSRPTVHQATIETDNKRRPGILRRNSVKFAVPPPEEPDPNSETKSIVISRLHGNLEQWDKQLVILENKKKDNDELHKNEIDRCDGEITTLMSKLTQETEQRTEAEEDRSQLSEKLNFTETELVEQTHNAEQLSINLMQFEALYHETEGQRSGLEQENAELQNKLTLMEDMKRRLNDQVTDLQGQVAILERRSSVCTIL